MRPYALRWLIVGLAFLATACDPGYRLRPVAWTEQPGPRWTNDFGEFSLRMRPVGGLVGESWLSPTFEVFANVESVTLKGATLQTAKGSFLGTVDSRNSVAPPGGGTLSVQWDFGGTHLAPQILDQRAYITLDVNVGSRPQTVRIEFVSA